MLYVVTGASGFVASELVPILTAGSKRVLGIDVLPSETSSVVCNIADKSLKEILSSRGAIEVVVINCAAARTDFGFTAQDYYERNVIEHKAFLENLEGLNVTRFVQVSSVAAIDGRRIAFSPKLRCDDAYRSTKFLQQKEIEAWCIDRNIDLVVLYPSAIFSDAPRDDTNIGKVQSLVSMLPLLPDIDVRKSVTYLPNFLQYLHHVSVAHNERGDYLTVEAPVLTVTELLKNLAGENCKIVKIPALKSLLMISAVFLHVITLNMLDTKLTRNRVEKLFSDISYLDVENIGVDSKSYVTFHKTELPEILRKVGN